MKNSTINYYNLNAQQYFDTTIDKQAISLLEEFCSTIPKGSTILDVGCGSGRDSLYFINHGYKVIAIDASAELAKLASEKIGQTVLVTKIEDLKLENKVDAVWAMASLLHIPKSDLPTAISKCVKALKNDSPGNFLCSLKLGNGQSYDENGRFFSYYTKEELTDIFQSTGYFNKIASVISGDSLGRETKWINLFAETNPQLQNLSNPNIKIRR